MKLKIIFLLIKVALSTCLFAQLEMNFGYYSGNTREFNLIDLSTDAQTFGLTDYGFGLRYTFKQGNPFFGINSNYGQRFYRNANSFGNVFTNNFSPYIGVKTHPDSVNSMFFTLGLSLAFPDDRGNDIDYNYWNIGFQGRLGLITQLSDYANSEIGFLFNLPIKTYKSSNSINPKSFSYTAIYILMNAEISKATLKNRFARKKQ